MKLYTPASPGVPEVVHCHFHITDGNIEYCGDFKHELAGKKVPMVPGPSDEEYGWPD